jgi:adenosine deaminase
MEASQVGLIGVDISRSYRVTSGELPKMTALPVNARALCRELHDAGLVVAAHCGKFDSAAQTWEAIDSLGATRIGHGIPLELDPGLLRRVSTDGIYVEVCPTAAARAMNMAIECHPIRRWVDAGVRVVLGSDHPIELQTTARNEYDLVRASSQELVNCIYGNIQELVAR